MKTRIKTLTALLSVLLVACMSLVVTSCGDDDEPETTQTYEWGFNGINPSDPDFLNDMYLIEGAFRKAVGINETAAKVVLKGNAEECDKKIREVCKKVFEDLKGTQWHGHYIFLVTNVTTGKQIVKCTIDADDVNFVF